MLKFLLAVSLIFPVAALAQDVKCPKGYQPYANRCVTQRMADYISCIEASGGNRSEISNEISELDGKKGSANVKGSGSGAIVKGAGSLFLDKASEKTLVIRLETKWFPKGMSECTKALDKTMREDIRKAVREEVSKSEKATMEREKKLKEEQSKELERQLEIQKIAIGDRFVPKSVSDAIVMELQKRSNQSVVIHCGDSSSPEPMNFSIKLKQMFQSAGWNATIHDQQNVIMPPPRGIIVASTGQVNKAIAELIYNQFAQLGYLISGLVQDTGHADIELWVLSK